MRPGLVTSMLIAGMLWLAVLNVNTNVFTHSGRWVIQQQVKTSAEAVSMLISRDLNRAGFGIDGHGIVHADSVQFTFQADLNNDGQIQEITWKSVSDEELDPGVLSLMRVVGSDSLMYEINALDFRFEYRDQAGSVTQIPADIRAIRFFIHNESRVGYGEFRERYAVWREIIPPNLNLGTHL